MASSELTTQTEKSLNQLVFSFLQYCLPLDEEAILTPGRFEKLVNEQLPNLKKNLGDLDEKMRSLDVNNDQKLEFGEYWQLLGELAKEIEREELGKEK